MLTVKKLIKAIKRRKTQLIRLGSRVKRKIPIHYKPVQGIKNKWSAVKNKVLDTVFDNYFGIRLMTAKVLVMCYLIFFIVLVVSAMIFASTSTGNQILHPINSSDLIIGVTTITLALLVPVAILLIEDSKEEVLQRRTIIKNIIQLDKLPIVVSIACVAFFVPSGHIIVGENFSIRTAAGAVLVCAWLFILMTLHRSYRWLSDGSTSSAGSDSVPSPDEPYPDTSQSYRFAQTVKFLNNATGNDAWATTWSKWYPLEYDDALHQAFFKRHLQILTRKQRKRYHLTSLELESYQKYLDLNKRNSTEWLYYVDYLKKFLGIYGLIQTEKKKRSEDAMLWRARNAISIILKTIISKNFTDDKIWHIFDAIDNYAKDKGLVKTADGKVDRDPVVIFFINELFEGLCLDKITAYDLRSYMSEHDYWTVTYKNLYDDGNNISFMVVNEFKNWYDKKVDSKYKDDHLGIYNVLEYVFSKADPITTGYLYWFMHITRRFTDENQAIKAYVEADRPYELMNRVTAEFVPVDEEADIFEDLRKRIATEEEEAIRLFATMYVIYFRGAWDLKKLIKAGEKLSKTDLPENHARYLNQTMRYLTSIQRYYDEIIPSPPKESKK